MRRAMLVVVALAGCDRLLRLDDITPLHDAPAGDAVGDASGDGPSKPCTLQPFMFSGNVLVGTAVTETTIAFDASPRFVVYQDKDTLGYVPITGAGPTSFQPSANHPAITRDGTDLFYFASDATRVNESYYTGGAFTLGQPAMGLGTLLPGKPAAIGGGSELRMVAHDAGIGAFLEVERTTASAAWVATGAGFTATDLKVNGTIAYPGLSADGLVLVFVLSGSTGTSVAYAQRATTSVSFADPSNTYGNLYTAFHALASPELSDDCATLYVVDQTTSTLLMLVPT